MKNKAHKIEKEGEFYERIKFLGEGSFGKVYLVKSK